ncbi:MAG: hypothetical protein ACYDH3_00095 [Candidatus Aminicenantales bacterium]
MSKYTVDEILCELDDIEASKELREAVRRKLRAADALQVEAIKVMGDLCLNDDPAFAELGKRIDAYEEA